MKGYAQSSVEAEINLEPNSYAAVPRLLPPLHLPHQPSVVLERMVMIQSGAFLSSHGLLGPCELSLSWHEKNNHIWGNQSNYSILLNISNNCLIKDIKISLLFTLVNVTQSIT